MTSRKQTVRTAIIVALALTVCLVHNIPVDATEPSDIQLTYVFGSQTLTVNVSHYVANTKTHYIENIEILKNGLSILNRSYVNQSFTWGMYDTFSVSTVVDDNLTVTALCSKGYSLTSWLIVTSATATNPSPTETASTTEPTNGIESPGTALGTGAAIVAGVGVVVFLIVFFAWLEPDRFRGVFKQLRSQVKVGFIWFGEKMSNLLQHVKTRLPVK